MLHDVSIVFVILLSFFLVDIQPVFSQAELPAWSAPPVKQAVSVRNGRTGSRMTWDQMLSDLARADVVFLGETHLDETTHRVEFEVLQSLLSRRENKVVLSMEMFERDVQPHLNAYLAGDVDERAFLSKARPWGNYRSAYRPLVETAKNAHAPVIAANFPAPLRRRMAMQGNAILQSLEAADKSSVPKKLIPNSKEYWTRVDNAIRGHQGMMGGRSSDDSRLYSTQTLWDNAMGESCADALDDHPGYLVLHVAGGFHTAYWQGTARQLLLRKPEAKIKTISIVPSSNPGVAELKGKPTADYVIYASAIASDVNDGSYSVTVAHDTHYKLSMPADIAEGKTVPLLIWLGDDGLNSSDGMDLWKNTLGDQVAIAVVGPRYKELQGDLAIGGRWFWPNSFANDIGSTTTAVERMWGYLLRNFPIDPNRVCIAGEGTGGTVAAAIALRSSRMRIQGVAHRPIRFTKLKDFPIPMPKYWGADQPPKRILSVLGEADIQSFWTRELASYNNTHVDAAFVAVESDPWERRSQVLNAIRSAMFLEATDSEGLEKHYVVSKGLSPRATHWVRVQGQLNSAADVVVVENPPMDKTATPFKLDITPDNFSAPGGLPICPGSFGGTTVLVIPDDATETEKEGWIELEENDPIAKRQRFSRLRVATSTGDRDLQAVLKKLREKNRRNVLIVPAVFCADSNQMQQLKQSVAEFENTMTLQWLPGLGGSKALQKK